MIMSRSYATVHFNEHPPFLSMSVCVQLQLLLHPHPSKKTTLMQRVGVAIHRRRGSDCLLNAVPSSAEHCNQGSGSTACTLGALSDAVIF